MCKRTGQNLRGANIPDLLVNYSWQVCKRTGGQLYYSSPYNPTQHPTKLAHELHRMITRPCALESVLRVRCSAGLRVDNYYGKRCF